MAEIPLFISAAILTNYFFTAFILSYIAPKIRIGKIFWYGLVIFFFIIFFHNLDMVLFQDMPSVFSNYSLFFASFFIIASVIGLFFDKRTWLGEETEVARTLLMPAEMQMMEKEEKKRRRIRQYQAAHM